MCNCTDCTCKNSSTAPKQKPGGLTPELYKYWYEGGEIEQFTPHRRDGWKKASVDFLVISPEVFFRKAKTPHVHAEVIKAWADGAAVQYKYGDSWVTTKNPGWDPAATYRIKPN